MVPLVDRSYFNSASCRLCCAPGESDACSDLEAASQRGWRLTQIEGQKTPVIRDDQAKQTDPVEVADCSRGCHDRSDVTLVRRRPTAFKITRGCTTLQGNKTREPEQPKLNQGIG